MIFDRHANLKYKYSNRHFRCRGYYVDTVGKNAKKIEEYVKKKGNTTGEFQWKIYEKYNGIKKLKAGFVNEMEAREYASFLENCNRMAGYNGSRFSIEYGCPVSEAQEEYDIWKAQFPKNLERTEIRINIKSKRDKK